MKQAHFTVHLTHKGGIKSFIQFCPFLLENLNGSVDHIHQTSRPDVWKDKKLCKNTIVKKKPKKHALGENRENTI